MRSVCRARLDQTLAQRINRNEIGAHSFTMICW